MKKKRIKIGPVGLSYSKKDSEDGIGEIYDKDGIYLTTYSSKETIEKLLNTSDPEEVIDILELEIDLMADSSEELYDLAWDVWPTDEELDEFENNSDYYVVIGDKHILLKP